MLKSSLTEFYLDINDLNFTDVQSLLSLLPNLIRFRLEGLSYDLSFAKGDLWQNLFEKSNKHLKRFDLAGVRIWLGNNADDLQNTNHSSLVHEVTRSFGKHHSYWGKRWSVYQMHKLRPNHLNLTLRAELL